MLGTPSVCPLDWPKLSKATSVGGREQRQICGLGAGAACRNELELVGGGGEIWVSANKRGGLGAEMCSWLHLGCDQCFLVTYAICWGLSGKEKQN